MSVQSALSNLRRLRRAAPARRFGAACQRCGSELPAEHLHLADVESRGLLCVCPRCHEAAGGARADTPRRPVPRRYVALPSSVITEEEWNAFEIPVGIAFFFYNSTLGKSVASYPSPAGAIESVLPASTWERALSASGWTRTIVPDVEAVLVRRTRDANESFIVPIDACYELVGRIRQRWDGFGGGVEVQMAIDTFFAVIRARSEELCP